MRRVFDGHNPATDVPELGKINIGHSNLRQPAICKSIRSYSHLSGAPNGIRSAVLCVFLIEVD